ncbi:MAG: hypothetical protein KJO67_13910, partial [Silicimonas sp.]|nr:hypothetical protein [Silicimonas sp.]
MMDEKIETAAEHAEAEALCRRQSAGTTVPDDEPLPEAVTKKPVGQKSPAEWAYQRLILYIKNFEKTLDDEHEIAMGFTDTGTGVLRIEGLGYFDPDIVTFYGSDGDDIVIGGDQFLPSISPNLGVYATEPEADPVSEWMDSCDRFRSMADDTRLVLPGHKLPFTGLA